MKTILTGVKPTGMPHLGNYIGAMKPAIQESNSEGNQTLLFIADYHSLTSIHDGTVIKGHTYQVAAVWLACGLNPKKSFIYRQSDIPEIFELAWILSCFTPKGFMNRAHAYKDKVQKNKDEGKSEPDFGVNMGLYNYPVLMAADILMFNADIVPVGPDQTQHIEFARDIAQKFNNAYGEIIKIPEGRSTTGSVPGIDGRKMSKSYDNHIPLFMEPKKQRKIIMKIKSDSSPPEAPKDPKESLIFDIHKEFLTKSEQEELADKYREGCGWGEAKQWLFDTVETELADKRAKYDELMADTSQLDVILAEGAKRTREIAVPLMEKIRKAVRGS